MAESQEERRFYPNKLARIYLIAIEDVMGSNGLAAVLNLAKLGHLIGNYPPDNLDREFGFADFSAINQAIEDVYGQRGAKGLCLRAGKATFTYALEDAELLRSLAEAEWEGSPTDARLQAVLKALADTFTRLSDQSTHVETEEGNFVFVIDHCPMCWGRASDAPVCYVAAGMLEAGLHWAGGGESFAVVERECIAKGDETCTFLVRRGDAETTGQLERP